MEVGLDSKTSPGSTPLTDTLTALTDWLFTRTRGQPFYLVEMFKELLKHEIITASMQEDGRWVLLLKSESLIQIPAPELIPTSVQEVIRARLNRLTPPARALLVASAILEQGLTFERLCQVARLDEQAGLQALEELLHSQLLSEVDPREGTIPSGEYRFPYEAIREIVYREAGKTRQRLFLSQATVLLQTEKVRAANEQ
jgi:predicted ATPase